MIKGFVFDFDGLILDTETPRFEVYRDLFAGYGVEISSMQWAQIIGIGHSEYDPLEHLTRVAGDHADKEKFRVLVEERVDHRLQFMPPFPGVAEFIQHAHANGISMAVASSSSQKWVHFQLDRLALTSYFDPILTLDDVHHPKPDPELYTLAAKRLGTHPKELMAFEDSYNGLKAAKAAGLVCIAIPNHMTREMNFDAADCVVNSFSDLELEKLLLFEPDKKLV
jgi:putative hydrolase of the HAD superfamily